VNVPVGNEVFVSAPESTNFTILSVTGQGYTIQTSKGPNTSVLMFDPSNATMYSLIINMTSLGPNYGYVTKQANPVNIEACANCNFTGSGNLIIQVNINATNANTANSLTWGPLFGMLPIKLQGFSVSFLTILETFAVAGFIILGLGIAFRSKVSYLGLAMLFIIGAITFGLLVVLGIIALYLTGFAIINLVWRFKSWKSKE
jgi:hypothetical protein